MTTTLERPKYRNAPGICRACGCTENAACYLGPKTYPQTCAWADRSKTLCTAPRCVRNQHHGKKK